jgi:NAD(P)-dependent dehydrogenase (short-subunit alcohol dehydrogenase family)
MNGRRNDLDTKRTSLRRCFLLLTPPCRRDLTQLASVMSSQASSVSSKRKFADTAEADRGSTASGKGVCFYVQRGEVCLRGDKCSFLHGVGARGEKEHHEDSEPTKEELQSCVLIVSRLAKNMDFFHSKECRPLRKALHPLVDDLRKRSFHGTSRSDYEEKKLIWKEKKAREAQQKAMDAKYLNASRLRKERLEKLQKLQEEQNASDMPLIPDGTAGGGGENQLALNPGPGGEHMLPTASTVKGLHKPRACYVCKRRFTELHHFYDMLCPQCAPFNFQKRHQSTDLSGYTALVTGGRVKIGYHIVLKLLRAGARVIATSRFPKDCALRFSQEGDFTTWKDRLDIFGLDLRDIPGLEFFCGFIQETYKVHGLDIVINNACQTIRRPIKYYTPLLRTEMQPLSQLAPAASSSITVTGLLRQHSSMQAQRAATLFDHRKLENNEKTAVFSVSESSGETSGSLRHAPASPSQTSTDIVHLTDMISSARQSQIPLVPEDLSAGAKEFPAQVLDVNGQQVDLRKKNTWVTRLAEVESAEVAEVFAINAIAPFVLNSRLSSLLASSSHTHTFIVNVSAMEGKFNRVKSGYHPHTNMAKAALNMMTATSAKEMASRNIYMNSVDTGWINDENPLWKASEYAKAHNFQTPLDEIDAAARVLAPVFEGVGERTAPPPFGKFFKDYHQTEW